MQKRWFEEQPAAACATTPDRQTNGQSVLQVLVAWKDLFAGAANDALSEQNFEFHSDLMACKKALNNSLRHLRSRRPGSREGRKVPLPRLEIELPSRDEDPSKRLAFIVGEMKKIRGAGVASDILDRHLDTHSQRLSLLIGKWESLDATMPPQTPAANDSVAVHEVRMREWRLRCAAEALTSRAGEHAKKIGLPGLAAALAEHANACFANDAENAYYKLFRPLAKRKRIGMAKRGIVHQFGARDPSGVVAELQSKLSELLTAPSGDASVFLKDYVDRLNELPVDGERSIHLPSDPNARSASAFVRVRADGEPATSPDESNQPSTHIATVVSAEAVGQNAGSLGVDPLTVADPSAHSQPVLGFVHNPYVLQAPPFDASHYRYPALRLPDPGWDSDLMPVGRELLVEWLMVLPRCRTTRSLRKAPCPEAGLNSVTATSSRMPVRAPEAPAGAATACRGKYCLFLHLTCVPADQPYVVSGKAWWPRGSRAGSNAAALTGCSPRSPSLAADAQGIPASSHAQSRCGTHPNLRQLLDAPPGAAGVGRAQPAACEAQAPVQGGR